MTRAKFSKIYGVLPVNAYKDFPEDAIDIPDALYDKYLNAEISGFDIVNGVVVERLPEKASKQSRINALNVEYEKDLVSLNNAWVSAKRVDGPNEEERLSVINAQITARMQKLQSDIQAILTEQ